MSIKNSDDPVVKQFIDVKKSSIQSPQLVRDQLHPGSDSSSRCQPGTRICRKKTMKLPCTLYRQKTYLHVYLKEHDGQHLPRHSTVAFFQFFDPRSIQLYTGSQIARCLVLRPLNLLVFSRFFIFFFVSFPTLWTGFDFLKGTFGACHGQDGFYHTEQKRYK